MEEAHPFAGLRPVADGDIRHPHAAGVDIGATEIVACIPGDVTTQLARAFGTYTIDLQALAQWFQAHGIKTVAMESTGVYWLPLFEMLEAQGLTCLLVSARALRRVPGKKSDITDAQWMQTLHQYGLLTGRFARTGNWLRSAPHHRAQLLEHRAPHILHMQKALLQMNVQLSQALTDVTGLKGLTILRAIVTGERDPQTLAAYWDPGCKKSAAEIGHALTGTWRAEHLFILQQALQLYDFYPQQLEACDAEIERMYAVTRPAWVTEAVAPLPAGKRKTHSKNAPPNQEAPASKTAQWRGSERHRGVWCVFGVNRDDGMWDGHAPVSHRKALCFLVRGRPET